MDFRYGFQAEQQAEHSGNAQLLQKVTETGFITEQMHAADDGPGYRQQQKIAGVVYGRIRWWHRNGDSIRRQ
ncbi:hypothetical protein CRQ34_22140 [Salmonella enterica subsp. enterica serovar Livingstone]|nr:hypothetical protein [Salmonella enterica subsp. enterica serovar Livingstone]